MDYKPNLLWLVIITFAVSNILIGISGKSVTFFLIITVLSFSFFIFMHGIARYCLKNVIVLIFFGAIVSFFYENLSLITGFPYGKYYYTDLLGPKLLHFPILAMLGYSVVAYISWTLTSTLLNKYDNKLTGKDIFLFPVVAAFLMTMWDYILDPLFSTVRTAYVWENGGSYFGVPFSNYLGWFLCCYTLYLCYALYLSRQKTLQSMQIIKKKVYWYQAVAMYIAIFLQFPMLIIFGGNETISTSTGQIFSTNDIYQSITLIAITTILFVSIVGLINVSNSEELKT